MSFFDRLGNLWKGFWSLWISEAESRNPEAVYETAIDAQVNKYRDLKKAVSGIVYLRNKLQGELEAMEKELKEIDTALPVAMDQGEDEVALHLLQRKNELDSAIGSKKAELEKIASQAEDAKGSLISFQAEIEKLKRERDEMLAKKATADARIRIQETLNGMSTEADLKALQGVRENIHKRVSEADVGGEIQGQSLDSKLKAIKAKTADVTAKAQLEELKKQMAARKAAAEVGADVKKTM